MSVLEFQEFMRSERDCDYYQNVDGEKEDIYDCPVLNAKLANGQAKSDKSTSKSSSSNSENGGGKKSRRPRLINHPTNQNS